MGFIKKWAWVLGALLVGAFFGTPIKRMITERGIDPSTKKNLDVLHQGVALAEDAIKTKRDISIIVSDGVCTLDNSGTASEPMP